MAQFDDPIEQVQARIKQIQARLEKTTEGPWWYEDGGEGMGAHRVMPPGELSPEIAYIEFVLDPDSADVAQVRADLDFIAHARQDIPWLLEQLQALLQKDST